MCFRHDVGCQWGNQASIYANRLQQCNDAVRSAVLRQESFCACTSRHKKRLEWTLPPEQLACTARNTTHISFWPVVFNLVKIGSLPTGMVCQLGTAERHPPDVKPLVEASCVAPRGRENCSLNTVGLDVDVNFDVTGQLESSRTFEVPENNRQIYSFTITSSNHDLFVAKQCHGFVFNRTDGRSTVYLKKAPRVTTFSRLRMGA